ncbi:MAG: DUF1801 domain-containing protein [Robiginitalea sp.]|uniref:DUF1801 domain-containing protein n=1 Tax=Robiginitalea sp. TaxID=1902411 RepID=UPI003C78C422
MLFNIHISGIRKVDYTYFRDQFDPIAHLSVHVNPAAQYILNQHEPFRSILLQLQGLIEQAVPECTLKYKYRLPFYYLNGKPFCYLNCSKDYVDLGFMRGAWLKSHSDVLITKDRKAVKSLRYRKVEEIDVEILLEVLQEAISAQDKKNWRPPPESRF